MSADLNLEAMIAARYAPPAWAVFYEVANGTGFSGGARRWADAVAIGIWPSRGHAIHGFEVKRSRGDWQRELADPTKADAVSKALGAAVRAFANRTHVTGRQRLEQARRSLSELVGFLDRDIEAMSDLSPTIEAAKGDRDGST